MLGYKLIPKQINTDSLGTFTGEVERTLSPYECAKEKCRMALSTEEGVDLCIANEGSFGPHPWMPFVAVGQEILFFIDRKRGFELTLLKSGLQTNYRQKKIQKFDDLLTFAEEVGFPSHALILRSSSRHEIYKGIQKVEELQRAFEAFNGAEVLVETDMRAHMNPTRMKTIGDLSKEMAERLLTRCPDCEMAGWGVVNREKGLPCEICQAPTEMVRAKVYGCVKCPYREIKSLERVADPRYCMFCNP